MAQEQEYGGFWARLVAFTLDNAIVLFILLVALFSMGLLAAATGMDNLMTFAAWVVMLVVPTLYWPVLESSSHQATYGKRLMGLQVTDFDGNRLSFLHALLRYLAKIISAIPLYLGFVIAAFTARKQALHDMIVKTLVVRSGPSQLWKAIIALIVGFVLMVASAAGLFYFVVMPMFKKGFEDTLTEASKGVPQPKSIPAPASAPKAPPAPTPPAPAPKIEAPAPQPAPAVPAPAPAPAPAATAPAPEPKAEMTPAPRLEPMAEPKPKPNPVVAAPKPAPAKPLGQADEGCVYKPVMTNEDIARCR